MNEKGGEQGSRQPGAGISAHVSPRTRSDSAVGRLWEQENGTSCRLVAGLGQVLWSSPMGEWEHARTEMQGHVHYRRGSAMQIQPQLSPLPLIWGNSCPGAILLFQASLCLWAWPMGCLQKSLRRASGKSPAGGGLSGIMGAPSSHSSSCLERVL